MATSTNTERVFAFIVAWKEQHDGEPPTLREISAGCGIAAHSAVRHQVRKLIRAGRLARRDNALCVVGGRWLPPDGPEQELLQRYANHLAALERVSGSSRCVEYKVEDWHG